MIVVPHGQSFPCTADREPYRRVKFNATTLTLDYAGASDQSDGTLSERFVLANGGQASVIPWHNSGTRKMVASEAIAAYGYYVNGANGKIDAGTEGNANGRLCGVAATADGDIVEVSPSGDAGDPSGADDVKFVDKLVTSAQVLALNATPIQVLAAGGAGVARQFIEAHVFLDYATTAYATEAGEDLRFIDGAAQVQSQNLDGTLFHATADRLFVCKSVATEPVATYVPANSTLSVTIGTGEWVTGDSPLKIRVFYRDVDTSDLALIA